MDGSLIGGVRSGIGRISSSDLSETRLTAKLAINPAALSEAYALRHESYLAYGHIDRMPSGAFADKFDQFPSSKSVLVYHDGCPAASVRVSLYAPTSGILGAGESPATEVFKNEVKELLSGLGGNKAGPRAADITRLVRHPNYVLDNDLVFALYRMAGYLILGLDADIVLAMVRPHHMRFYRRMGFTLIADPKPCPRVTFRVALMACFRSSYEGVRRAVPFLEGISTEDATFTDLMSGQRVPVNSNQLPLLMNTGQPWRASEPRIT